MLYILYATTIIYCLVRGKNNKYLWVWIALLQCVLSVTSKSYADLEGYTQIFNLANSGISLFLIKDWPIMWLGICKMLGLCGFNYRGMVLIILVISTFLFHQYAKEFVKNKNTFWAMFLLFPALVNIVQLRFYLGTAIAVQSLRYLSTKQERKLWVIRYFAVIFLATMIHSSCIVFGLFILTKLMEDKSNIKIVFSSVLGVVAFSLLTQYIPKIAALFIDSVRMNRYFYAGSSAMTLLGQIKVSILWVMGIVTMSYCIYSSKKYFEFYNTYNELYDKRSLFIMCMCGICIPLMAFDANFFRILEFGYLITYVSVSNYLSNSFERIEEKGLLILPKKSAIVFIGCIVILLFATSTYAPKDSVIEPLFRYDGIVKILK